MQSTTIPRKYFLVAGVALATIGLLSTSDDTTTQSLAWGTYNIGWSSRSKLDVFDYPPVDSLALQDICSSTAWNESLIFTCNNNFGGVANVRNNILNCVRYTIAAGGSLVLPQIKTRQLEDEMGQSDASHESKLQGMDYMFDVNHFSESLQRSCPQLVLLRNLGKSESPRRRALYPESLFPNLPTGGLEHPEEWPEKLNDWIARNIPPVTTGTPPPIIIDLEESFLHYPTHSDGHAVAHVFGNILKFRSDVRQLATKTLNTLVEWYDFPVNISRHGILKPSFIGAHLNTRNPVLEQRHETDLVPRHEIDVEFSHYDSQFESYIDLSSDLNLSIFYLASGNLAEVMRFCAEASDVDVTVTYKEDLLKDKDLKRLQRLTYDQRALVDYLVLTRAERFMGVGHSPFSWNVALSREQMGSVMEGKLVGDVWEDGMNTLFGVRPDYVESSACMWS
ncbi:hypothetical protein K3495_g10315 [Podosphaera aphanis]|nr:hypothetical protein K3495_g10315 [Podosphaera aphanis]